MPFLFREIVICECGRPALHNSLACRTCYEDGLRRQWREDFRQVQALDSPIPMQMIKPRIRREFAPALTVEDAARIRASMTAPA